MRLVFQMYPNRRAYFASEPPACLTILQTACIISFGTPRPAAIWPRSTIVQSCDESPKRKSSINRQSALELFASEAAFVTNWFRPKPAKTIPWHEASLAKDVRNFASNSRTSTTGSPTHGSPLRALSSHSFLAKSTFHESSMTTLGCFFLQAVQNANTGRRTRARFLEVVIKSQSLRLLATWLARGRNPD